MPRVTSRPTNATWRTTAVINPVLLDTGPLVAFLNRNDDNHGWSVARFKEIEPPFLTCEAVLSETIHLLAGREVVLEKLEKFLIAGFIRADFAFTDEVVTVTRLMRAYRNVPMSLADACLVRMSELSPRAVVFTLDSDFLIYRKHGRQTIPLILPTKKV